MADPCKRNVGNRLQTSVSGREVEAVNVRKISYPANVVMFGIKVCQGGGRGVSHLYGVCRAKAPRFHRGIAVFSVDVVMFGLEVWGGARGSDRLFNFP